MFCDCGKKAKLVEFATFSYYYCDDCKDDIAEVSRKRREKDNPPEHGTITYVDESIELDSLRYTVPAMGGPIPGVSRGIGSTDKLKVGDRVKILTIDGSGLYTSDIGKYAIVIDTGSGIYNWPVVELEGREGILRTEQYELAPGHQPSTSTPTPSFKVGDRVQYNNPNNPDDKEKGSIQNISSDEYSMLYNIIWESGLSTKEREEFIKKV